MWIYLINISYTAAIPTIPSPLKGTTYGQNCLKKENVDIHLYLVTLIPVCIKRTLQRYAPSNMLQNKYENFKLTILYLWLYYFNLTIFFKFQFFFILVFHGKNRYFHCACMRRKNFIRGKRGPVYDMEYYNCWNVNHLTLDYNNL